jgi:hypothetical protein
MTPSELPAETVLTLRTLCKSLGFELGFSTMVEHKESIDDALREVNKLTVLNMTSRIPIVIKIVEQITNISEFSTLLYKIILKNPFFSDVYAALYAALVQRWPQFKTEFVTHHKQYLESIALKDENAERRAFTSFMVSLTAMRTLPPSFRESALTTVMSNMEQCIDNAESRSYLYDLVELLMIIKPSDSETIQQLRDWSTHPIESHPGLTYKIQFRMMDVLKN